MILVKVQSAGVIFKIMEVYVRYTLVNDELNCLPHWVMNCFGTMADGQSVYHAGWWTVCHARQEKSEKGRKKAPEYKNNLSVDPD